MRKYWLLSISVFSCLALLIHCSPESSPTSSSPALSESSSGTSLGPSSTSLFDASLSAVSNHQSFDFNDGSSFGLGEDINADDFSCVNLQSRQVRFGSPGSVKGNVARLYYNYEGVPYGRTKLQIFWDYANEPGEFQMVDIGFGEVQRNDDTLSDFSGTVEHVYRDLVGTAQRAVRVVLKGEAMDGDCVTVRHITVTNPGVPGAGPKACVGPPAGQVNETLPPPPSYDRPYFPGGVCSSSVSNLGAALAPYSVRTFQNCTGGTATLQVNVASPNCDPMGMVVYLYGNRTNLQDPQPFNVGAPCNNMINTALAINGLTIAGVPADTNVSIVISHRTGVIPPCPGGINVTYQYN